MALNGQLAAGKEQSARNVRVRCEPAFVLSTQPWRETSLIAELLTRSCGRVTVVVRGAKRTASRFRGLINPFVPLVVNFSGASDIKNLTDARWLGGLAPIGPQALASAFYVNELVLRLTARNDPAPRLFEAYTKVLADLAQLQGRELSASLRLFEIELLSALGWGQESKKALLESSQPWFLRGAELVQAAAPLEGDLPVGEPIAWTLVLARLEPGVNLRELRDVLRRIIGYYAGERGFNTRKTLQRWANI